VVVLYKDRYTSMMYTTITGQAVVPPWKDTYFYDIHTVLPYKLPL